MTRSEGAVSTEHRPTWLVTEHGPIGSVPLLRVASELGPERCVLVTTSFSSHLLATCQGRPSIWLDGWWRAAPTDAGFDPVHHGAAELARADRFRRDDASIVAAVQTIEAGLRRRWAEAPPRLVVLWERRRALGSLVAALALEAGVPVVVVQNGFAAGTMLVDRVVSDDRLMMAVRRLDGPTEADASAITWRRPAGVESAPLLFRGLATAGIWIDYAEKAIRAGLGFPSLIPWSYWSAFLRVRTARAPLPLNEPVRGEAAARPFVLLALHAPPTVGRLTNPWRLLRLCLDHVPAGIPLVICPHPGDRFVGLPGQLADMIARRPETYFVRDTPTWHLLDRAMLVVTLTSAIGLEATTRGIPTLAADSAPYVRPGLAHGLGACGEEILRSASRNPAAFRPDPEVVRAFLATAVQRHIVIGNSQAMTPEVAALVAARIETLANVHSAEVG